MNCPFNKGNNMCYAVINSPNPCQPNCILHKLLEVLSTITNIDTKLAKPEIDLKSFENVIETMLRAIPEPDLSGIEELKTTMVTNHDHLINSFLAGDYSEDITKLKKAVSLLAVEIGEIKDLVKKVQIEELKETIAKTLGDAKVSDKLEKSVENLISIVTSLREKVPETII